MKTDFQRKSSKKKGIVHTIELIGGKKEIAVKEIKQGIKQQY